MGRMYFRIVVISCAAISVNAFAANTITAITVNVNSATQATVKYTTRTAVASQVKYGATSSYGKRITASAKVKAHSLVITGLKASTTYHYQIVAGAIVSPDATFVTAAKAGASPSPSPSPSAKPSSAPSPSPTVSAAPSSKPSSAPSSSPSPTASPLIEGYVSDLASYGFDMNCGMTNTVEDEEYGCLPVTTTGAKIVANGQTLQPGVYIRIYGSFDASNLPMVLATEVDYSATAFSGSPTIPAGQPTLPPAPSPSPTPTQTPLIEGYVSDIASYGFDMNCGMVNAVQGVSYGCLPVTTTNSLLMNNGQILQAGVYVRIYGSYSSNLPMIMATEVDLAAAPFAGSPRIPAGQPTLPTPAPSPSPSPSPSGAASGNQIVVQNSGLCLTSVAGSIKDPINGNSLTGIEQQPCVSGSASQQFNFAVNSQSYYTITQGSSCLDVTEASSTAGAQINLNPCNGQANELFSVSIASAGVYSIQGQQSALCLDVTGDVTTAGAFLEQWGCNQQSNQKFAYSGSLASSPAPTGTPTSTPSSTPSSTSGSSGSGSNISNSGFTFVNGQPIPAGFVPYSPTSVWNKVLTNITSSQYTTDSATIISAQFGSNPGNWGAPLRDNEPGQYDGGRTIYYVPPGGSGAAYPSVNMNCAGVTSYGVSACWGNLAQLPSMLNIPEYASPSLNAYGADSRMDIIDANGNEDDWYSGGGSFLPPGGSTAQNTPNVGGGQWTAGSTITGGGFEGTCGNYFTGDGLYDGSYAVSPGATAGGQCSEAGLVTINDLLAGSIHHALAIATPCTANGGVYPAFNQNTNACSGPGPMLGYRMWYDVPDATTNAVTTCNGSNSNCLWPYEKAILNALHDYGAFVMDDGGGGSISSGGIGIAGEGIEPFFAYGTGDKWAALSAQGWFGLSIANTPTDRNGNTYQRWFAGDSDSNGNWTPYGVNFATHMHYLQSCVALGTC